jgi:hypothetical protein
MPHSRFILASLLSDILDEALRFAIKLWVELWLEESAGNILRLAVLNWQLAITSIHLIAIWIRLRTIP